MTLTLQYAVIVVLVCASAMTVLAKIMPKQAARVRLSLGTRLMQAGRPAPLRKLGLKLAQPGASGGCDSGCSTCGSCGSGAPASQNESAPLTFMRRVK